MKWVLEFDSTGQLVPVLCLGKQMHDLVWELKQTNLEFVSINGLPSPPFSLKTKTKKKIVVKDDNRGGKPATDYSYDITILDTATNTTTTAKAVIRNEPY